MSLSNNFPTIAPSLNLDFANVKALDPRITFTRTTTATYYDGKTTTKAEENLLTYSQEFDETAWTKSGTTITPNDTVAPDGTTTADKAEQTTTSNPYVRQSVTVSGQYQFSVFVKYIDIQWIRLLLGSNSVWFDVQNGVVGSADAGLTGTIQASTNGFYRLIVNATGLSGATLFYTIGADADNSTGESLGSYYLWGAQVEQRSAVTAYTPTTTQPITNYVPVLLTAASGVARFDHNPTTGESLGLLVEEQRTNLILQSEDFSTSWTNTNSSEETNVIVAPDGTLTGDKLIANTVNGQHRLDQTPVSSAGAQTFSVYAKAGGYDFVGLRIGSSGSSFNLSTGVVAVNGSGSVGSIQSVGNGWYRCSVVVAAASANDVARINITDASSPSVSFAGNDFDGIYIWGAQLEAGAFPTSYIPTVAATVTRNADVATMTGTNFSSWYRADEGTFFYEFLRSSSPTGTHAVFAARQTSTLTSRIAGIFTTSGPGTMRGFVADNNVTQADMFTTQYSTSSPNKFSMAYQTNNFGASGNGGAAVTDASGTVPTVEELRIGQSGTSDQLNGHIRKLAFYPSRLSNAQLQALTTV